MCPFLKYRGSCALAKSTCYSSCWLFGAPRRLIPTFARDYNLLFAWLL